MYLDKIYLLQFKNYEEADISFSDKINVIVGENGSGKTNLLDAIYYLCLSKSAFQNLDNFNIFHEKEFFLIKGNIIENEKKHEITCSLQRGKKKILLVNKVPYEKMTEHIGRFPCILISPNDTELITDGSENRRKFFDGLISQTDSKYLEQLMIYSWALKQRNSTLKLFAEKKTFDPNWLEPYNKKIIEIGKFLAEKRQEIMFRFIPIFEKYYQILSRDQEKVNVFYETEALKDDFEQIFANNLEKDLFLQRTNKGIHKDDYKFVLGNFPINKFGSQGQQKSFVIALKLAQFTLSKELKNHSPILLLDDIFDKLDDKRMKKLLEIVSGNHFGQVFITDARSDRALSFFGENVHIFQVRKGKIL